MGQIDPMTGMVMNIRDLKKILQKIIEKMDHRFLNLDVPEFNNKIPTTENIAAVIWKMIQKEYPDFPLFCVRLWEGDSLYVEYLGDPACFFNAQV